MTEIIPTPAPQEGQKKKAFLVTIAVIGTIIILSFGIYFILNQSSQPKTTINEELVELNKNEFVKKIKDIEKNPPENVNGDDIIKLLPESYESDISQAVETMSEPPFVRNELLVMTQGNFNSDILIAQIAAVGAKPVSRLYNNFTVLFPPETSLEDFYAAKDALSKSSQVKVVTKNSILTDF